jgi:hypothetical protein
VMGESKRICPAVKPASLASSDGRLSAAHLAVASFDAAFSAVLIGVWTWGGAWLNVSALVADSSATALSPADFFAIWEDHLLIVQPAG